MSHALSSRQICSVQIVSKITPADGVCHSHSLGRLCMREFQLWVASCELDPMRHGAQSILVTPGCASVLRHWQVPSPLTHRVPMGSVQEGCHYGRQPDRLGWNSRGSVCNGPLEVGPLAVSHTCSGTVSGVPLPETFPSVSYGSSGPGENGQYDDDGVHQTSMGVTLQSVAHAGTQTDPVVLQSSPLPESDTRPRSSEQGRGPVIQGHATIRGVDSTPRECGTDMGLLQSGHSVEWLNLSAVGLARHVISTIQSARATSTGSL